MYLFLNHSLFKYKCIYYNEWTGTIIEYVSTTSDLSRYE